MKDMHFQLIEPLDLTNHTMVGNILSSPDLKANKLEINLELVNLIPLILKLQIRYCFFFHVFVRVSYWRN